MNMTRVDFPVSMPAESQLKFTEIRLILEEQYLTVFLSVTALKTCTGRPEQTVQT